MPLSNLDGVEPRAVFTNGPMTLEVFDGWAALCQNGAQIDLDDTDLDWLNDVLAKRDGWAGA